MIPQVFTMWPLLHCKLSENAQGVVASLPLEDSPSKVWVKMAVVEFGREKSILFDQWCTVQLMVLFLFGN